MSNWKFKSVSDEEFDNNLRRRKVPEHLILKMREISKEDLQRYKSSHGMLSSAVSNIEVVDE